MPTEKELLAKPDTNSTYNKVIAIQLINTIRDSNPGADVATLLKILSQLHSIFAKPSLTQILWYLAEHGAATSTTLKVELGIPEATVFRCIRELRAQSLVEAQIKVTGRPKRDGPRPTIWGLPDCTDTQVAEAIQLHTRCQSPKYRVAETLAQTILSNYVRRGEVTYVEVLAHAKMQHPQSIAPDIANLAAQYLIEKGIKVWR